MAESVRRRSWGGVLPLGRHASISGSSLIHCASVSMAPPRPRGAKRPSSQPVQARTGPSLREHFAEAVKSLDDALQISAAATHEALQRLASRGADYTDNDLKDALA